MTTMTRYPGSTVAPEIFAWLESALPFSVWRSVPVEEYTDERGYVLRAELPDRNPEKDISVTVADGTLTIAAKREQAKHDSQQSEFRYGGVSRTVSLPAGVNAADVKASYSKGILEIHVPIEKSSAPHRVSVSFDDKK
jgi:HSP20 family protein